jgi:hypothetical protein
LKVNRVTKYPRRSLLAALGAIALLPVVAATTGSVTGLLKDDMGMPVAGGKVTLVDLGKGTSTMATTNSKGYYGFPLVMPGVYKLQAEAKGFASQERSAVSVHVGSALRIDLVLKAEKDPR